MPKQTWRTRDRRTSAVPLRPGHMVERTPSQRYEVQSVTEYRSRFEGRNKRVHVHVSSGLGVHLAGKDTHLTMLIDTWTMPQMGAPTHMCSDPAEHRPRYDVGIRHMGFLEERRGRMQGTNEVCEWAYTGLLSPSGLMP
jgi:hypothetical protein